MKEIAEAADISRQGLYLYFKTKEEVYSAAVEQRAERLLVEIRQRINGRTTVKEQILNAFEIWTIRDFETEIGSPEAREIYECTQAFMSISFDKLRLRFEAILATALSDYYKAKKIKGASAHAKVAHLIYSSVRGLKLSARSGLELRKMIQELLNLILAD